LAREGERAEERPGEAQDEQTRVPENPVSKWNAKRFDQALAHARPIDAILP
jgi:hypothetical protein